MAWLRQRMTVDNVVVVIVLGAAGLLWLAFYLLGLEFKRVASDEIPAAAWLRSKGASISKEGRERHVTVAVLTNKDVRDEELFQLRSLSQLKKLELGGTGITDRGIKYLCDRASLEELNLSHTRITDAGLTELTGLPNLAHLDISYTAVTLDGAGSLLSRSRFPRLTIVGIAGLDERRPSEQPSKKSLKRSLGGGNESPK